MQEVSEAPAHLLIAMPCRNEIRSCVFGELLGCMLQAASYWHRAHGERAMVTYSIHPRAHVVAARNAAAQQALDTGASWVLWLDDDMMRIPAIVSAGTGAS